MLQARGAPLEALEHYQALLHYDLVRPRSKTHWAARYACGEQNFRCLAHLSAAASCRPDYFDAQLQIWDAQEPRGISPARFTN